ncbi:MAG TPA: hypothetical protein VFV98_18005 [Vicinamibacterales bacterium]|nr:hypothetical protein [Vicinamibacterales bacterium]
MSLERQLRALAKLPRPQIRPFWSARVTARAAATTSQRSSIARGEALYWMALTVLIGPLLLTSWQRVVFLILVLLAVRVVAALSVGTDLGVNAHRHTRT